MAASCASALTRSRTRTTVDPGHPGCYPLPFLSPDGAGPFAGCIGLPGYSRHWWRALLIFPLMERLSRAHLQTDCCPARPPCRNRPALPDRGAGPGGAWLERRRLAGGLAFVERLAQRGARVRVEPKRDAPLDAVLVLVHVGAIEINLVGGGRRPAACSRNVGRLIVIQYFTVRRVGVGIGVRCRRSSQVIVGRVGPGHVRGDTSWCSHRAGAAGLGAWAVATSLGDGHRRKHARHLHERCDVRRMRPGPVDLAVGEVGVATVGRGLQLLTLRDVGLGPRIARA